MTTPDLTQYDVILVNSSAGKDSQCMLDLVAGMARDAGVLDRVVVAHADLGRVEWEGTRELAERQARHYGVRFEAVSRSGPDLLDQVRIRGRWPASNARYCTSDFKRGPIRKLMTHLVRELEPGRPARILNCMGLRAEESPARAKKPDFRRDEAASNGRREVDEWLPIRDWKLGEVWSRIRASGAPWHPAYDAGMSRLSCVFCVLAKKSDLETAARLNPGLLLEYAAVEREIGHDFKHRLPIASLLPAEAVREAA